MARKAATILLRINSVDLHLVGGDLVSDELSHPARGR